MLDSVRDLTGLLADAKNAGDSVVIEFTGGTTVHISFGGANIAIDIDTFPTMTVWGDDIVWATDDSVVYIEVRHAGFLAGILNIDVSSVDKAWHIADGIYTVREVGA